MHEQGERKRPDGQARRRGGGGEAGWRALAGNLPGIVYRIHLRENNRMEFLNRAVETITGFRAEELGPGEVCFLDPLIPPDHRQRVIDVVREAVAQNRPFSVRYPVIHRDGSTRWLQERGAPVWEQGAPLHIYGVIFDVTGETQALEADARRHQALLHVSRLGLAGWRPEDITAEALAQVREVLHVEQAALLELAAEADRYLLRLPAEWAAEGESRTIPISTGGVLAEALGTGEAVVLPREGKAASAALTPLLDRLQADGVLCAAVGQEGRPRRLLAVFGGPDRSFTVQEQRFLEALANVLTESSEWQSREEMLREAQKSLEALYEDIPVPTYTWRCLGDEFVLERYNRAAGREVRGRIERLIGRTAREMYPDMPEVLADFEHCVQGKAVIRREMSYRFRLDGGAARFLVSYAFVPPDVVLVQTEDISERSRREQTLQWQAQIIDQIHDSVVSTDLDGNVTSWNRGAERLFGYSAEEAVGRHISFVYPEEGREFLEEQIIAPLKAGGSHEVTVQMRHRSGRVFWAHLSLSLLRDPEGAAVGMIGYSMDVTERKEAEREAAGAAARLSILREIDRAILEAGSAGAVADAAIRGLLSLVPASGADVLIFDHRSGKATALAGYDRSRALQVQHYELPLEAAGDPEALRRGEAELIGDLDGAPAGCENGFCLGPLKARSLMRVPLLVHGELLGVLNLGAEQAGLFTQEHLATAREVAHALAVGIRQAHLLEEIGASRMQLRRLTRQLVTILESERHRVSRELHEETAQVMSAVKMSLQLLRLDLPPQLAGLRQHISQTLDIVDGLMGRVRALAYGLRPPALDTFGLGSTLEGLCRQMNVPGRLEAEYSGQPVPALSDLTAVSLYRLCQEALSNVRRHSRARHVEVTLRPEGERVLLSVEDDGVGFEVPAALARSGGLTGIGLAGMRQLAELLGGELSIRSRPGQGTRLTARLPFGEPPV